MTLAAFSSHVGERYTASAEEGEGTSVSLVLIEAERSPRAGENDRPFHLLFQGGDESQLEQGTYRLEREGGEAMALFLVPVGPRLYEAIFN